MYCLLRYIQHHSNLLYNTFIQAVISFIYMTYSYFHFPRSPWQAGCPRSFVSDTRRIPVSHKYPPGPLMTGSKRVDNWTSGPVCECSEIAGSLKGSPPAADYVGCEAGRRICSECETGIGKLCAIKWDYHIVSSTLVMVQDEAHLRQGHNDQSRHGHQWSETTLTGESQFHISTPLGIEPGSLMTGSKRVDHWTSGTVCECNDFAGSLHPNDYNQNSYWTSGLSLLSLAILVRLFPQPLFKVSFFDNNISLLF
jgi:hypothetical protein